MTLDEELLEQARHLVRRERRRPRQASLRRSVSAAYYAMFHLLVREASTMLISVVEIRDRVARAFVHGDMKQASQAFVNPQSKQLSELTGRSDVPIDLSQFAKTFVMAQYARNKADYDVARTFTRVEVIDLINLVEQAFQIWHCVRTHPTAQIYLATLLFWRTWKR